MPTSKKKLKCVLCGKRLATTRDHIPPKCLFGSKGNRPPYLPTMPACKTCNLGTSGDDEFFRLFLAANHEASQHPTVKRLHDPIIRSLARPQARGFTNSFLSQIRNVTIKSPGGLYLGEAPGLPIDHSRLQRIIEKVVRGLFFHEYDKKLPPCCGIRYVFLNSMRQHLPPNEFNGFVNIGSRTSGRLHRTPHWSQRRICISL